MRRKRNMTPWPLATPEETQWYTMERTRTNAGAALLQAQQALEQAGRPINPISAVMYDVDAILPRIEVRIEQVRIDPYGEATGIVWTRVDSGEWISEGGYLLSRKVGAPKVVGSMPPDDDEPLPDDFDLEENYRG